MQGRLLKGLVFIVWELVVNTNARINLCIMDSLQGKFDMAKQVVDTRWLILYVGLYVYAMWDAYRGTIDLNKQYILADREDSPLHPVVMKTFDASFPEKRSPWLAAALSLISPGLGHLYVHKVITGMYFIAWTVLVIYYSHALPTVHRTFTGAFSLSKVTVDMQWLMYLPSIYGFVLHDAYVSAVEYNKLFEKVQSRFLRDHYQRPNFKMPL